MLIKSELEYVVLKKLLIFFFKVADYRESWSMKYIAQVSGAMISVLIIKS